MLKKIFIAAFLVCIGVFAFAQAQPKAILSKADVDTFVKNYAKINEILDSYDAELSSLDTDFSGMAGKTITDMINKARNFSVSAKLRGDLAKFGLGNNGFEKCMVIIYGMTAIYMEEILKGVGGGDNSKEVNDMIKNQINPMKAAIHAGDFKLITAQKDALIALLN